MPRDYKHDPRSKVYKKTDKENLERALHEIKNGMSYRDASVKYKIHYSVLYRHFKNPNLKTQGGQTALTKTEEEIILKQLITCADWGYPLDKYDLRVMVKTYLDSRGKTIPKFKNNLPGKDFVHGFLKRHKSELRTRMCQNIKRSRAAMSPQTIGSYFDHLSNELIGVPPSNIINFDETNLSDDPGRKRIITKRGCRYPERVCNTSKSCTSVMFAASADGKVLPPYVVYKAQNMYESWTVGGIKGARYNRSPSGWFDAISFGDWVTKLAIPALKDLPGKKILIGDNLSSHFSSKTVNECLKHNISFIFLPSNSTHMTQPLDVAFFRPLKAAWRKILEKWKMGEGRRAATIPKDRFPHFIKELMDSIRANQEKNIKSGFRKCGIYPLDREQVLNRLPAALTENVQEIEGNMNNVVVDMLKSMRYYDKPIQRKIRRKVEVVAGKSVTGADFRDEKSELNEEEEMMSGCNGDEEELPRFGENEEELLIESDDDEEMNLPLAHIAAKQSHQKESIPAVSIITEADFRDEESESNKKEKEEEEAVSGCNGDEELLRLTENEEDLLESDDDAEMNLLSLAQISTKQSHQRESIPSVSFKGRLFKHVFTVSKDSIQVSDWLLVAFPTKSKKFETFKYYIGKVLRNDANKNDDDICGTFLRHRSTRQFSGYVYGFPVEPDICFFFF